MQNNTPSRKQKIVGTIVLLVISAAIVHWLSTPPSEPCIKAVRDANHCAPE
jgi:hypothetical protein